ncbi:hypothetical protein J4772_14565 [Cohnella sp. LGH]|nr:hypothetical protein J4772_14565 [Cohnella sp. LGH]
MEESLRAALLASVRDRRFASDAERTLGSGTGYTGQYHSPNCDIYESPESCPDELLQLWDSPRDRIVKPVFRSVRERSSIRRSMPASGETW